MSFDHYLWVEKFRPRSVKDMVLPSSIRNVFLKYVEDKDMPHILLESRTPGSGKTSLSKALCNDLGADSIYINASAENGIDTLRTKVLKFATSRGIFESSLRVVILDEVDGTTGSFQDALRPILEEYSKNCRFILTCNYANKLSTPLKSRCQVFSFDFTDKAISEELKKKTVKRLTGILKLQECEFDEDVVARIVDEFYPDIRSMINKLQQYAAMNNNIIDESFFKFNSIGAEFYDLIFKKDIRGARKYIIENSISPEQFFLNLYTEYLPMIEEKFGAKAEAKYAQSLIMINQYQYYNQFVIDKEINQAACIVELIGIL